MMEFDVLTLFPEMFASVLGSSILKRAQEKELLSITCTDIRPFSSKKHKNTDDYPFGGGNGMLMTAQPVADALRHVRSMHGNAGKVIFLGPKGVPFTQKLARELSREKSLILLCGHYEGIDQRILDKYVDLQISIGDYILTGGELPAMVLIDAVARLIPGVLSNESSAEEESFSSDGLLEYPQYTRPQEFEGMQVPDVLMNGNHAKIAAWRREQALLETAKYRPDLLKTAVLSPPDMRFLQEHGYSVQETEKTSQEGT